MHFTSDRKTTKKTSNRENKFKGIGVYCRVQPNPAWNDLDGFLGEIGNTSKHILFCECFLILQPLYQVNSWIYCLFGFVNRRIYKALLLYWFASGILRVNYKESFRVPIATWPPQCILPWVSCLFLLVTEYLCLL